jgi:hypothetical protein
MKFNIFSAEDRPFGYRKRDSIYGSIMSERIGKRYSTEMTAKRQAAGEYPTAARAESRQLSDSFAQFGQVAAGAGVTGRSI